MLRRRRFLGAVLLLAFLALVFRAPVVNVLGGFLHVVLGPVWKAERTVKNGSTVFFSYFQSRAALVEENRRLSEIVLGESGKKIELERVRRENEELRAMLGRTDENTRILARILAGPREAFFDALVLDAGALHGVFVGAVVYGPGEIALGEVSRIFGHSAVVSLYSSPGRELTALVGASSSPATLSGDGGGSFRAVVPRGLPVEIGDAVEVPALGGGFAGTVRAIDISEHSSLKTVFVSFPFNIHELRTVVVEIPPDDEESGEHRDI